MFTLMFHKVVIIAENNLHFTVMRVIFFVRKLATLTPTPNTIEIINNSSIFCTKTNCLYFKIELVQYIGQD